MPNDNPWMTFVINESQQNVNMRLIAITLQRKLSHVTEKPAEGKIIVKAYTKSQADRCLSVIEDCGLHWT